MSNILSYDFIYQYKDKPTPMSNYGLGEFVYKRTYSRIKPRKIKDNNGNVKIEYGDDFEEWHETIERVVNGVFKIKKNHYLKNNIEWDNDKEVKNAQVMYDKMFNVKFLPGGRNLWAMGTKITDEKGLYSAVNNCAGCSTKYYKDNPAKPFEFVFDASMLGVGIGFDTKGGNSDNKDDLIPLFRPNDQTVNYVIEDSREGWVKGLHELLTSYFTKDKNRVIFDYSQIRPAGQILKTFGGTSSGYEPLKKSFDMIADLLDKAINNNHKFMTSSLIVSVMNIICLAVISGNVRRSATIALGEYNDNEFIELKDYDKNPERITYGWLSNNSINAHVGMDYSKVAENIRLNGEPGLIWMDNIRKYSLMNGIIDNKDKNACIVNACGEQTLDNYELCNLVEVFINRNNYDEFMDTLKYAFMYAKCVSLCETHWEDTNEVIRRNRRIGCSLTGITNFIQDRGIEELRKFTTNGYKFLKEYDKELSNEMKINQSIKITCIKPSGTISNLVPGTCSGIHYPVSNYYIRRVRVNINHKKLLDSMINKGYNVVKSVTEPNTMIIEFPIDIKSNRCIDDVSMWEQLELCAKLNEWWCDNQVSCTVMFDPRTEGKDIKYALDLYQYRLKGISFLPTFKKLKPIEDPKVQEYPQMPFEPITKSYYELLSKSIKNGKINIDSNEQEEEIFCTTDTCILRSVKKNKDTKIIFMNGLAGSGKSYIASKLLTYIKNMNLTCELISKDDFRYINGEYIFDREYEKVVEEKYFNSLKESLNKNLNYIILDNTHIGNDFVNKTLEYINGYKMTMISIKPFKDLKKHIEKNIHICEKDSGRIIYQNNNWLVNYPLYRMHKVLYEHVNDNNFDNEMIEKIIKETLEYFKK